MLRGREFPLNLVAYEVGHNKLATETHWIQQHIAYLLLTFPIVSVVP